LTKNLKVEGNNIPLPRGEDNAGTYASEDEFKPHWGFNFKV